MKASDPLLAEAFGILEAIAARGRLAVIAGGAVRDGALGRALSDADIATDMSLEELATLFTTHAVGRSRQFETVVVVRGGRVFEITRFRGGAGAVPPGEGARSAAAVADLLRKDAAHRDFTINALLLDAGGRVLDFHGGLADLRARLVRAVGEPTERFEEDPARLMRAARFAACLDFAIEPRTEAAVRAMAPRLAGVAPERLGGEILKMAAAGGPALARGIELLDGLGLLRTVLPEVADLQGLEHPPDKHPEGGVWEHTLAAVRSSASTDPGVNLAVLLHDIGKRPTHALVDGRPTYHGHEAAGAALAEGIARRLALPQRLREALVFAIDNHRRAAKLDEMRRSKRLALVTHEHWPTLRALSLCDRAARGDAEAVARRAAFFAEAERDAAAAGAAHRAGPVISGTRIMELTGLAPGPRVGTIQRQVTEWALDGRIEEQGRIEAEALRLAAPSAQGGTSP
ncbi:MAG TPA: HD domain-containing protein [bacterium]